MRKASFYTHSRARKNKSKHQKDTAGKWEKGKRKRKRERRRSSEEEENFFSCLNPLSQLFFNPSRSRSKIEKIIPLFSLSLSLSLFFFLSSSSSPFLLHPIHLERRHSGDTSELIIKKTDQNIQIHQAYCTCSGTEQFLDGVGTTCCGLRLLTGPFLSSSLAVTPSLTSLPSFFHAT